MFEEANISLSLDSSKMEMNQDTSSTESPLTSSLYSCKSHPIEIDEEHPIRIDRVLRGFFLNGVKRERINVIIKLTPQLSESQSEMKGEGEFKGELSILKRLQSNPGSKSPSRYIVDLLDHSSTSTGISYLVLEEFGEPLNNFFPKKMTSAVQLTIAKHILSAVNWLHGQKIVHCDLKPDNILVRDEGGGYVNLKLCDFDSARDIGEPFPCEVGVTVVDGMTVNIPMLKFTRFWVCPEVYDFNRSNHTQSGVKSISPSSSSSPSTLSVTPQMDIFNVGLVLICLLSPENERSVSMTVLPENEIDFLDSLTNPDSSYLRNKVLNLREIYHESLLSLCCFDSSQRGSLSVVLRKLESVGLTGLQNEVPTKSLLKKLVDKVETLPDVNQLGDTAGYIVSVIEGEGK